MESSRRVVTLELRDRLMQRDRTVIDRNGNGFFPAIQASDVYAQTLHAKELDVPEAAWIRWIKKPLGDAWDTFWNAIRGSANEAYEGSLHIGGMANRATETGAMTLQCVDTRIEAPDGLAIHANGTRVRGESSVVLGSNVHVSGERTVVIRAGANDEALDVDVSDQLVLAADDGVSVRLQEDAESNGPVPPSCIQMRVDGVTGDPYFVFRAPNGTVREYDLVPRV